MDADARRDHFETHHLTRMVCGALPGTTGLDTDYQELPQGHLSGRMSIAERNWRFCQGRGAAGTGGAAPQTAQGAGRGCCPVQPRRSPSCPFARPGLPRRRPATGPRAATARQARPRRIIAIAHTLLKIAYQVPRPSRRPPTCSPSSAASSSPPNIGRFNPASQPGRNPRHTAGLGLRSRVTGKVEEIRPIKHPTVQ